MVLVILVIAETLAIPVFLVIAAHQALVVIPVFQVSAETLALAEAQVYQWNWKEITGNQSSQVIAKPWAWVEDQSALYIQECSDVPFQREYGPIYQDLGNQIISWGNRGFTSETNFETRNGRFINIRHSSSNLYVAGKDYDSDWTSEYLF